MQITTTDIATALLAKLRERYGSNMPALEQIDFTRAEPESGVDGGIVNLYFVGGFEDYLSLDTWPPGFDPAAAEELMLAGGIDGRALLH